MYSSVFPEMERLMEECGDTHGKLWCECYGYRRFDQLVLEDLKVIIGKFRFYKFQRLVFNEKKIGFEGSRIHLWGQEGRPRLGACQTCDVEHRAVPRPHCNAQNPRQNRNWQLPPLWSLHQGFRIPILCQTVTFNFKGCHQNFMGSGMVNNLYTDKNKIIICFKTWTQNVNCWDILCEL